MTERLKTAKLSVKAPILETIRGADLTKVFIGLGAGVDPDGLASQLAMAMIVKDINPEASVHLFYRGEWDRAQNRTMREILNLDTKSYDEFDAGTDNFTTFIMVDGNISAMPDDIEPDFVIDHHDGHHGAKISWDVRKIGSCSAIMWEYVMAQNPLLFEGPEGAKLATALTVGINTDTINRTVPKTSPLDWEAEAYCGIRSDHEKYAAIINYQKPSYQKDMEMQAWNDKDIEGTTLTTPLGVIPVERKGVISSTSEEFCGQGPVKTTLAAAMIDGDIHFSVRTFNTGMSVDSFIKKRLTKNGRDGFGGGKPGAGAGVVKLPHFIKNAPVEIQKEVFQAVYHAIQHNLYEFVGDGVRDAQEAGE